MTPSLIDQKILKQLLKHHTWRYVSDAAHIVPILPLEKSLLDRVKNNDPTLTSINISSRVWKLSHYQALLSALTHNTTVTTLILRQINCQDDGATALADLLTNNKGIKIIDLSYNSIENSGAIRLAQALEHNQTLVALILSSNIISDAGADAFAHLLACNTRITALDLYSNRINDAGLASLINGLKQNRNITHLNLGRLNGYSEETLRSLVEWLKGNNTIKSLTLMGMPGAQLIADAVKDKKQLETLNLGRSFRLANSVDLTSIATLLQSNGSLKELYLAENNIGKSAATTLAKALRVNHTLKVLGLRGNPMGALHLYNSTIYTIANSLQNHPSINHIDLSECSFGNKGATDLVIMLEENPRITVFDITENKVDHDILVRMRELLDHNKQLVEKTAQYIAATFSISATPQGKVDRDILKHYQACDEELLYCYMKQYEYDYQTITHNVNRYIASNFLWLAGCFGNGRSRIEQLSPQIYYKIFSYLQTDRVLWLNEISGNLKSIQREDDKKGNQATSCSLW